MPEVVKFLIPIIALIIPIVAILTHHQQKMAQIFRANTTATPNQDVDGLRREVAELKQLVAQQAIQIDDLRSGLPQRIVPPDQQNIRLGG